MYEQYRYTDRSRKVMKLTEQESVKWRHEYLGTEHLLLGLAVERCGVAGTILNNNDVDATALRTEIQKRVPQGEGTSESLRPMTPELRKVVEEYCFEEAGKLNHNYVGTEHLLLALTRVNEGPAVAALQALGLSLPAIRQEVLDLLGHGIDPAKSQELLNNKT